jgi:uncharacterized protein YkwD
MQFGSLSDRLPRLLLAAGLLISGSHGVSLVPECRPESSTGPLATIYTAAEQDLELEMLALTNQHRIRRGLQALTQDDALAQIARTHSSGMAQQGFISHHLPSGDLQSRMNRAGYRHGVARENVASAPTVITAQQALVASPAHESNILATDVTRVGIGIVRCPAPNGKELYITEIFAAPREEFRPGAVRQMYMNQVNRLADENSVPSLRVDPALEELASRLVLRLEYPPKKEQIQRPLAESALELQNEGSLSLSRIEMDVQFLHNPNDFKLPKRVREGQARTFGTAVRQVDNQNQTAFMILTLIGYTNN